jgi:hypothetical protein
MIQHGQMSKLKAAKGVEPRALRCPAGGGAGS